MIIDKKTYVGPNSLLGHGEVTVPNIEKPELLTKGISVVGKNVHLPEDYSW